MFRWSPFLRLIATRVDVAREMACDARAAQACGGNGDLAAALLTSVDKLVAIDRPNLLATMFENRSHLALRIETTWIANTKIRLLLQNVLDDLEERDRRFYTPDRNGVLSQRETASFYPDMWWMLTVSGNL